MVTKERLLESIKQLPNEFTVDEIIDRILLLDKIETGLQQSKNEEITPDEELDRKLPEWLN
ncbi:hypothetical protein GCM10023188_42410 [Pontibacter saemangeumensis]|uniref:Addiction module component n=1 Tax=Pontibacter saemangeumensis TaxID=1084525 RepID=A0ABP8M3K4_9BACT